MVSIRKAVLGSIHFLLPSFSQKAGVILSSRDDARFFAHNFHSAFYMPAYSLRTDP